MNPTFTTINDPKDPTFNQLLGINNEGKIAGYFGSGMTDGQGVFHPNKGYTLQVDDHRAQSYQRELPGLGADPGHRHQQRRSHRRLRG